MDKEASAAATIFLIAVVVVLGLGIWIGVQEARNSACADMGYADAMRIEGEWFCYRDGEIVLFRDISTGGRDAKEPD